MARAGDSARAAADRVAQVDEATRSAAEIGMRAAVDSAINLAVDQTSSKYNLTPDRLRQYVGLEEVSGLSATVQLRIRPIPIEEFAPEIRMRRYTWRDKLGRRHSQELPSVYFQRLRDRKPRLVRPAFPLEQRTSGQLRAGEKVRRRVGSWRERLTNIRYFSFPHNWLRNELIPAVESRMVDDYALEFRASFNRFQKGRNRKKQATVRRN